MAEVAKQASLPPGQAGAAAGAAAAAAAATGAGVIAAIVADPTNNKASTKESRRIIIKNLPLDFTLEGLRELASPYGRVIDCKLLPNTPNDGKESLRRGVVTFLEPNDAGFAQYRLEGKLLRGVELKAKLLEPITNQPNNPPQKRKPKEEEKAKPKKKKTAGSLRFLTPRNPASPPPPVSFPGGAPLTAVQSPSFPPGIVGYAAVDAVSEVSAPPPDVYGGQEGAAQAGGPPAVDGDIAAAAGQRKNKPKKKKNPKGPQQYPQEGVSTVDEWGTSPAEPEQYQGGQQGYNQAQGGQADGRIYRAGGNRGGRGGRGRGGGGGGGGAGGRGGRGGNRGRGRRGRGNGEYVVSEHHHEQSLPHDDAYPTGNQPYYPRTQQPTSLPHPPTEATAPTHPPVNLPPAASAPTAAPTGPAGAPANSGKKNPKKGKKQTNSTPNAAPIEEFEVLVNEIKTPSSSISKLKFKISPDQYSRFLDAIHPFIPPSSPTQHHNVGTPVDTAAGVGSQ